jgi:hypothetical protein
MDSNFMKRDEKISKVSIDVNECFKNPGKWQINEIFETEWVNSNLYAEKKPEIYIQAAFVPEGEEFNVEPELKYDLEKEIAETRIDGRVLVNLVHAKHLADVDIKKSKIFGQLKYEGKVGGKTGYATGTSSPSWNKLIEYPVHLETVGFLKNFVIEIRNKNRISTTLLGSTKLDFKSAASSGDVWPINKVFKLKALDSEEEIEDLDLGEVYIQAMY